MDVREKLVELQSIITCPNAICNFCEHFKNKDACEKHKKEVIADNMIAHGVTVQKWISVKERLPEDASTVLAIDIDGTISSAYYVGRWHSGGDLDEDAVTYWMPLPTAPKEDK